MRNEILTFEIYQKISKVNQRKKGHFRCKVEAKAERMVRNFEKHWNRQAQHTENWKRICWMLHYQSNQGTIVAHEFVTVRPLSEVDYA